jgi:spermidine/putrescine transport system permease protein
MQRTAGASRRGARRRLAPYLLTLPGGLWLALFFLVPIAVMASLSLQTGDVFEGFKQTWNWRTYLDSTTQYHTQFVRALEYGTIATIATLVISYPMAYWIAFHGGRRKATYLLLILLPFFVTFVIRTLSWQFLLADQGVIFGPLKEVHLLSSNFRVLATTFAVVCGLTYNFLPFMALPLYVSLERIDPRLVEAAEDLYASKRQAFFRVILPLSVPGIFAGILLTFIPASADFINSTILGGVSNTMVGTNIQTEFLVNKDYPTGSALSFIFMAVLLLGVFAYARLLGSERIQEYVG